MKAITTEKIVLQQNWSTYSRQCPRGSGYCKDTGVRYILFRRWRLWGWNFWDQELDREKLPSYVWITRETLGSSVGWESKFKEYIK